MGGHRAAGLLHGQLIDAPDADHARIAIVEFPRLPAAAAERFGESVGLLRRLHQTPLQLHLLAAVRDRFLVEGAGPGEGCHPHAIPARAVEQAVGDIGIHVEHELVHLLSREEVFRQEWIRNHKCQMHRTLAAVLVEPHHPPEIAERLALAAAGCERLGVEVLDFGEHLLPTRVVEGGEVAHEHGDLRHLFRYGIPHLLWSAVGIESEPALVAREVERLLMRVGLELVGAAEFLHELTRVVAGSLATERRCQHHPWPVALGQREHCLRVDRVLRKPGRGQPACLGFCHGAADRQADGDQHQRNPGG